MSFKKMQNKEIQNVHKKDMATVMSLNVLKLTVALELKHEGYTKIEFDRVIEANGIRAHVHVWAQDELGVSLAIICINKVENLNPTKLLDLVTFVQRQLGEDCEVSITIPLNLLVKARDIFGLTPRMFLIDDEFRVWTHSCRRSVTDLFKSHWLNFCHETAKDDGASSMQWNSRKQACNMQYVV